MTTTPTARTGPRSAGDSTRNSDPNTGLRRAPVSGWLPATVRAVEPATSHGRLLRLEIPDWAGSRPGQHLDLRLTAADGYQAVRSYSIASFGPENTVEIGVDEYAGGEVSPYLVREARPGDQMEVRGPIGRYFVWLPDQPDAVQLVAGGSGVVPLLSIVRAHHAAGSTAPFRMLYSVRTAADAMFAAELAGLVDDHFALDWIHTRQAPPGGPRPAGRISAADLQRSALPPAADPLIYVCGPTGFVELVATDLIGLGHRPERIRTERFGGA